MEAKEFDFEFPRGDTCPFEFELIDSDGNPIEADSNCEIFFTVKKSFSQNDYLIQKRYSRGEIVRKQNTYNFTLVQNTYNFTLEHNDTANMKYGTYVYDIQFKNEGYVKTILKGSMTLTEEATWISNE